MANHTGQFVDPGATCADPLEGDLTSTVTHDVVKRTATDDESGYLDITLFDNHTWFDWDTHTSPVGAEFHDRLIPLGSHQELYIITYYCQNDCGNYARNIKRYVSVRDEVCPSCPGAEEELLDDVVIEASFPFYDPGISSSDCYDNYDGVIPADRAFATSESAAVNVEQTGTYTVTYILQDSSGNWNYGVGLNEESNTCSGPSTYTRNIVVADTLKPVITLTTADGSEDTLMEEQAAQRVLTSKNLNTLFSFTQSEQTLHLNQASALVIGVAGLLVILAYVVFRRSDSNARFESVEV